MSGVDLNKIIVLLREYSQKQKTVTKLIIVGGLALQHYGLKDRHTYDVDAEVRGNLDRLRTFLKSKGIPSDLGENISNWSVVSIPTGYQKRASTLYKDHLNKFLTL